MLRHVIHRVEVFLSRINHNILKKFKIMDKHEKIIALWSLGLFVLVLISPLMSISSNSSLEEGLQYVFLLTTASLWKSFVLIQWSLLISVLWLFHNKFKTYIVENLWFQWDNYLFLFFVFLISLTSLTWMGEVVSILTSYTMILKLTPFYYGALILLVLLLAYCFYLSMYKSQRHFKWHVVGYHERKDEIENEHDGSLFDSHH